MSSEPKVVLRAPVPRDLEDWFLFQLDQEANEMAAFTSENPQDRKAYIDSWTEKLERPTVFMRTILAKDQVVGSVGSFDMFGQRELTYWIGREFWGRGYATQSLHFFLGLEKTRPIFARAASHNKGSCRVLEKCGFESIREEVGFSQFLQRDVKEQVYELSAPVSL